MLFVSWLLEPPTFIPPHAFFVAMLSLALLKEPRTIPSTELSITIFPVTVLFDSEIMPYTFPVTLFSMMLLYDEAEKAMMPFAPFSATVFLSRTLWVEQRSITPSSFFVILQFVIVLSEVWNSRRPLKFLVRVRFSAVILVQLTRAT